MLRTMLTAIALLGCRDNGPADGGTGRIPVTPGSDHRALTAGRAD